MAKTILMVEDKKSLRDLVKAYLTQEGFRVVTADNGRRALFVARHEKPDLILLDIMMPEMDGYDFIRTYRKERDTPILAILMSAPDRVFSRSELLMQLQGVAFESVERTVDVHIRNLRTKIEPDPGNPRYIETVFGVGYRFCAEADL